MIHDISRRAAGMLGNQLEADKEQTDIFAYGLEIIIGGVVKFALVVLLAYIFGILETTLISVAAFIVFRHFGGGVHLSTYARCLSLGLLLFLTMGKLAVYDIHTKIIIGLLSVIFFLGIYIIIKWVPAGTQKKNISCKDLRSKQKLKAFIALIVWMILNAILIYHRQIQYGFALILGATGSFFFISPLGYR
ncbi:MAG: accessory gene regulator ArgB-like protein, partial [Clostridia bacterium]